ncbi:catalase [Acinetobacter baumannii]
MNRNPENFFLDVEQSAFAPSNLVPGISASQTACCKPVLFNYADAQRYRLGVNYQQIPVNAARCQFIVITVTVKDASMPIMVVFHIMSQIVLDNGKSNSVQRTTVKINGDADFWNYREDDNDYSSQPRLCLNL